MERCDYWWGSHACDLDEGHAGFHICYSDPAPENICSEFDHETSRVRFNGKTDGEWYPSGGGRISDIPIVSFEERAAILEAPRD